MERSLTDKENHILSQVMKAQEEGARFTDLLNENIVGNKGLALMLSRFLEYGLVRKNGEKYEVTDAGMRVLSVLSEKRAVEKRAQFDDEDTIQTLRRAEFTGFLYRMGYLMGRYEKRKDGRQALQRIDSDVRACMLLLNPLKILNSADSQVLKTFHAQKITLSGKMRDDLRGELDAGLKLLQKMRVENPGHEKLIDEMGTYLEDAVAQASRLPI